MASAQINIEIELIWETTTNYDYLMMLFPDGQKVELACSPKGDDSLAQKRRRKFLQNLVVKAMANAVKKYG